ncbi:MAG: hypothetical protein AYK19_16015 [Theionarchaea archaeon DG-70-1]|nr:MAG: hypothetical protein AYK19_16015 [Theionarchaea archaeon DG-70-1]
MNLSISKDECRSILMRLHTKTPPENISPIFVETEAAKRVLEEIYRMLNTVSQGQEAGFLIIKADRGAGKTAVIQYLKENLFAEVFFVYLEKSPVSSENLFRFFINNIGRQQLVEAVRNLSSDPLEVHKNLSEGGHNGTAIALAGLLDTEEDCWSWLSSRSPALKRLKCGLRMVKNVSDDDALQALTTVVNLLARQKPVVFAVDELEGAFNELKESEKKKLGSLLVNLINQRGLSDILFLFAATDPVYERCFLTLEADAMGLRRRVEDATAILGLPTPEEVSLILERIFGIYTCAYDDIILSAAELEQIRQNYDKPSTMPSTVISYALKKGDRKVEEVRHEEEMRNKLVKKKRRKSRDRIALGREFEYAVGKLLEHIPKSDLHLAQTDAIAEGELLKKTIPGLGKIQKYLDWSFRIDTTRFWVETCITKKEDSVIPTPKALAIFAKTLYNEGSIGLFITHNHSHFSVGRGAGRVISRYPELKKCVGILNLDKEQYEILMGISNVDEKDLQKTVKYISEKIGLDQMIKDLRGGRHFFW